MKKKKLREFYKELKENSAKVYYDIPALNWGETINGQYAMTNRYIFNWKYSTGTTKSLVPLQMDLHDYILKFKHDCYLAGRSISAFVGTDSQNHSSVTNYVTVICLKVAGNGVHVLVSKMNVPKIYENRYRLLKETDFTAEFVRNNKDFFVANNIPLEIHADYNEQTNHKSNGVVTEAKNYIGALGFDLVIKRQGVDGSWSASYGADRYC